MARAARRSPAMTTAGILTALALVLLEHEDDAQRDQPFGDGAVLDPGLLLHDVETRDVPQRLARPFEAALQCVLPARGGRGGDGRYRGDGHRPSYQCMAVWGAMSKT